MTDAELGAPETILRQCAAAAPDPWYPSEYVRTTGITRADLDPNLDKLRLAGLIRLTDWMPGGKGQGCALTEAGSQVLESPRELERLRNGKLEASPVPAAQRREMNEWRETAWERGEQVRNALYNPSRPLMTFVLIAANVLVFLAGMGLTARQKIPVKQFLEATNNLQIHEILHETGALSGTDIIVHGEWWRLISCCFVHIGFLHLLLNMIGLYAVGRLEEDMWGRVRFLVLYFLSGLAGSCAMVASNPATFGAGASGAIWGIMIGLVVWVFINRSIIGPQAQSILTRLVILVIVSIYASYLPHVSAAAHFGGGAAGLVVAVLLHMQRFGNIFVRLLALAGLVAVPIGCLGVVVHLSKTDARWQEIEWRSVYKPQIIGLWDESAHLEETAATARNPRPSRQPEVPAKALAGFRQAREKIERAMDLIQRIGPYQDESLEKDRQRMLEGLGSRVLELDASAFNKVWLPYAEIELEAAKQAFRRALPALLLPPGPREAQGRLEIAPDLLEARARLNETVTLLEQAGPFAHPRVEDARLNVTKLAFAEAKLLELAARRLQRSVTWTQKEEDELVRLERQVFGSEKKSK
jgi:membrane associated rhomboid family serine protease